MAQKNNKKNSSSTKLLYIVTIPMLVLVFLVSVVGYNVNLNTLIKSKKDDMKSIAALCENSINLNFPGDYELTMNGNVSLYKGDVDITTRHDIVDELSSISGLDLSLIYSDTRILTTVFDKKEGRLIGSGLTDKVLSDIKSSDDGVFYSRTIINKENFFTYYLPTFNSDDSQVGAIEVCCPYRDITSFAWICTLPAIILSLIAAAIIIVLTLNNGASNDDAIEKLLKFTKDAASGNDAAELDPSVTRRNDALGTIGDSVLSMHRSLREMMDKDPLTKLYNRRCANRKLDIVRSHYENGASPYCIAIGDIDFFKKVNDTYGHDAGDVVLQTVASILEENMKSAGFVSRWGGEEFLLVFDRMDLISASKKLTTILNEIRAVEINYGEKLIKVTMSFGLTCDPQLSHDEMLNTADEKLYYAKEHGRNQIVSIIPEK